MPTNVTPFPEYPPEDEFIAWGPTACAIAEVLTTCQKGPALAVIAGPPGIGKSSIFSWTADTQPGVWHVSLSPACAGLRAVLQRTATAIGGVSANRSSHYLQDYVIDLMENAETAPGACPVLIVDEFHHAPWQTAEGLRAIFDESYCGLVLAGNRFVIERFRTRATRAAYTQLASRALFLEIDGLTEEDIEVWCNKRRVSGRRQRQVLHELAQRGGLRKAEHALDIARAGGGPGTLVTVEALEGAARRLLL